MGDFYFCVDIGGTFIKAGIVDNNNNIIYSNSTQTSEFKNKGDLSKSLFEIILDLASSSNLDYKNALGIGIGITGLVDSENGIISYTIVTNKRNYPLKANLEKLSGLPVKIGNDADVATLAEQFAGAGVNHKNFVMLTIGTGIGLGIVLNGKNLGVTYSRPVEIGHTRISDKKTDCTCGEIGCYERLGSTSALVKQVKDALKGNPNHIILKKYKLDEINGKIIFDYISDDLIKTIINQFIEYVALGIINLVNIFKPEIVIIGGAISKQKDNLITPVEEYVNNHSFLKFMDYKVKIIPAEFTGDAGMIGAKYLFNEGE